MYSHVVLGTLLQYKIVQPSAILPQLLTCVNTAWYVPKKIAAFSPKKCPRTQIHNTTFAVTRKDI